MIGKTKLCIISGILLLILLPSVIGEDVAYIYYKDFKKDTLYIRVEDAIWAGELEFYKEKLKRSLSEKRKNPVRSIRFTLS